jgi:two-component SAPR family response regulator
MDDLNGFELYREIKKIDSNVKACFLTASNLYLQEIRSKEYDTLYKEQFIRKPIETEKLIEKIKWLISE